MKNYIYGSFKMQKIILEGITGSGKSSNIGSMKDYLESHGKTVSIADSHAPVYDLTKDVRKYLKDNGYIVYKKHGKKEDKDFFIVLDRRSAIQFAVNKAKKGDVLGFFGKGHEKSLCIGKKECPWNEIQEVENAVRKQIKNGKN